MAFIATEASSPAAIPNLSTSAACHFKTKKSQILRAPISVMPKLALSFYFFKVLPSPSQEGTLEVPNMTTAGIFKLFAFAATTVSSRL